MYSAKMLYWILSIFHYNDIVSVHWRISSFLVFLWVFFFCLHFKTAWQLILKIPIFDKQANSLSFYPVYILNAVTPFCTYITTTKSIFLFFLTKYLLRCVTPSKIQGPLIPGIMVLQQHLLHVQSCVISMRRAINTYHVLCHQVTLGDAVKWD